MAYTNQQLTEFKLLYAQRFGIELTDEEAEEKALKLISIIELIYEPMTKEEYAQVQKRQTELKTLITKESK